MSHYRNCGHKGKRLLRVDIPIEPFRNQLAKGPAVSDLTEPVVIRGDNDRVTATY